MTTQPSTPQSNIELIRKAFSALGRKDVDAVVKLMPSDFIINIAGMPIKNEEPTHGVSTLKSSSRHFQTFK